MKTRSDVSRPSFAPGLVLLRRTPARPVLAVALPFLLLAAWPLGAQGTRLPQEVGIEERLGQTALLDEPLRDEGGRPTSLRALVDKPTILSLNYFRCAGICTPQLGGIADVLNRMDAEPGRDYQVVTVSFDPRDTPEIAAMKRANYLREMTRPFPPGAWRFLTGEAQATRALAEGVGFRFKRQGDEYVHPAALILLSPAGKVTRYLYGTAYVPADLRMAITEAARGEARPSVRTWLQVCFSYDPEGRRYVFSLTRTVATLTLAGAALFTFVLLLKRRRGGSGKERP